MDGKNQATTKDSLKAFMGKVMRPRVLRSARVAGRNDLCPCGSKMKFKFCHGMVKGQRPPVAPLSAAATSPIETNSAFTMG